MMGRHWYYAVVVLFTVATATPTLPPSFLSGLPFSLTHLQECIQNTLACMFVCVCVSECLFVFVFVCVCVYGC